MKLLIIADDFTGALDTGVQLSKHNIPTTVMSDPDTEPVLREDCQVLVINANIRHSIPEDAYNCVHGLLRRFETRFTHVYLKTDSVLRGNLSAAFAAVLDIYHKPLCFVPAFPELGRTTIGATAYVNGQLLEDSVFKDDPRTPSTTSNISEILNKSHTVACEHISSDCYTNITQSSLKPDTVYIIDCETSEQMSAIGGQIADENLYPLTAGCAGFATTFATHLPFKKTACAAVSQNGPVLFISGSANAVTLKQLEYAKQHDYSVTSLAKTMFVPLNYTTDMAKDKAVYKDLTFCKTVESTVSKLLKGQSVVLATATNRDELNASENIKKQLNSEESLHNYIASYTSSLVKSILDKVPLENLTVFGGDMVAAILEQLDCHQVEAQGEIVTGVPLCRITYGDLELRLATKSGGFGDEDVICAIEQYFRNDSHS